MSSRYQHAHDWLMRKGRVLCVLDTFNRQDGSVAATTLWLDIANGNMPLFCSWLSWPSTDFVDGIYMADGAGWRLSVGRQAESGTKHETDPTLDDHWHCHKTQQRRRMSRTTDVIAIVRPCAISNHSAAACDHAQYPITAPQRATMRNIQSQRRSVRPCAISNHSATACETKLIYTSAEHKIFQFLVWILFELFNFRIIVQ